MVDGRVFFLLEVNYSLVLREREEDSKVSASAHKLLH